MSKKLKFILLLVLISLIIQNSFSGTIFAISISSPPKETDPRLQKLRESLLQSPNFLQYTEYKMLQRKSGSPPVSEYDYEEYRLKPRGTSPLSKEFRSEINRGSDYYWFTEGVDLLTGTRAIDESLQLGSIGVGQENFRIRSDIMMIESALKRYYNKYKYYPSTLEQLSPNYLYQVPAGFSYQRIGNSYELKFLVPSQLTINISEIEPLSIKSHPWQTMIKGDKPQLPDIFLIVPADYFMIYFKDVSRLGEFENAIKSMGGPLENLYGLKDATEIKDKIFKRLQIKDIKELRLFIDEAVLVSYDLDFSPHTDYALVLKLKISQLNNFVSNFVNAPADRHGKVGDHYVIATDSSMYQKISSMAGDRKSSLAESQDVAYILSLLESNYDGFAYFSEAFIKKLTSPTYRINARRRNTILNALETIQYMVFAYRDITGEWPNSVQQIIDEGYIASNSIASIEDYSIDSNGIVKHKIWNTIYDVTPVGRVPITAVFPAEKSFYDNFRQGYEQYWREFIDPIGIAILIGDQIRFHTIILPLIEESRYNWVKNIAGLDPIEFDFIRNLDRAPSLQLVLKLNLDDTIYAIYKGIGTELDEEYQKCVGAYYKKSFTERRNTKVSDFCKPKEKTQEEAIKFLKEKLAKALDWKESGDVLGFIGNEITLAAGDSLNFRMNDFSNLDLYFGLELTNTDLAKKFLEHVFKWYEKQISGYSYGRERSLYGMFGIGYEPIKNEYNGVEFYIIPTGFTNIYYTFLNNRFYITLSQKAINQLIDGSKSQTIWSAQMFRMSEYLGKSHNAMFVADGSKLQNWAKSLIREQWFSYSGAQKFKQDLMYYTEALTLAKTLPGYDGSIKNVVQNYYTHAPIQWFDAKFLSRDGTCYLNVGDNEYNAYNIKTRADYYYSDEENQQEKVKLEDIAQKFNIDATFAKWEAARSFGIGLKLTKEGLDIMIAFNNPERKEFDPRVPSVLAQKKANYWYIIGIGVGILVVIVAIIFIVRKKRRSKYSSYPPIFGVSTPSPKEIQQENQPDQSQENFTEESTE